MSRKIYKCAAQDHSKHRFPYKLLKREDATLGDSPESVDTQIDAKAGQQSQPEGEPLILPVLQISEKALGKV
jgi:hypothetical protein